MNTGKLIAHGSVGLVHNFGRLLTLALAIFQLLLPSLRSYIGDEWMVWVTQNMWWILLLYLNYQLLETSRRDPTNMLGFFADNGLAFLSLVAAIVLFARGSVESDPNARNILLMCFAYSATDFLWGILFSLRIAFAGKERGEFERRATTG